MLKICLSLLTILSIELSAYAQQSDGPLVVGIFDSLIPGTNPTRARASLENLVAFTGEQVGVRCELIVVPGGTRQAIEAAAETLNRGEIHLLAMTGVEYGWLRQQSGTVYEPLAISDPGARVYETEQLLVRKDDRRRLNELNGAVLGVRRRMLPSQRVYLSLLQREYGATSLSKTTAPLANVPEMLQAVLTEKADAAIVDLYNFKIYERAYPRKAEQLKVLQTSPPYPLAPVVGNPEHINQFRDDLWNDLRETMSELHQLPRAQAFLEVWSLHGFHLPDQRFTVEADQAAKVFPLDLL